MIVIRRMVDRRRAYTAIFLKGEPPKIFPTSDAEHARILRAVLQRKSDQAQLLLRAHIEASKAEVRKITVHMLYEARRGQENAGQRQSRI